MDVFVVETSTVCHDGPVSLDAGNDRAWEAGWLSGAWGLVSEGERVV